MRGFWGQQQKPAHMSGLFTHRSGTWKQSFAGRTPGRGGKRAKKVGAAIPQSEVEKPWERLDGGDGMGDGEEEEQQQQQEEQQEEQQEKQEEEEEEELQNNSRGSLDKEGGG
jgi:hypothetical protein